MCASSPSESYTSSSLRQSRIRLGRVNCGIFKVCCDNVKCYRKILRIGWTEKVKNIDLYGRIQLKENIMQKLIGRKLGLFGHICRMHNNRKIKKLMFGRIEDTNKRGRPHMEWLDDFIKWGGISLQKLSQMASERGSWRKLMKLASETYGR